MNNAAKPSYSRPRPRPGDLWCVKTGKRKGDIFLITSIEASGRSFSFNGTKHYKISVLLDEKVSAIHTTASQWNQYYKKVSSSK